MFKTKMDPHPLLIKFTKLILLCSRNTVKELFPQKYISMGRTKESNMVLSQFSDDHDINQALSD